MSESRVIPLSLIDPPKRGIRTQLDEEAMARLCDSIEKHGLLQPVVVRDLLDGRFRLIAGSRRKEATARLGIGDISCSIYTCDDEQEDEMLFHENLHREDVAPLDEAVWLREHMALYGLTIEEMARRVKCSPARLYGLLSLLTGDPAVSGALSAGRINKSQAFAINRIRDAPGRETALHWAINQGMSAEVIKGWALERERRGLDQTLTQEIWDEAMKVRQETKNQAKCVLHEGWVDYPQANWLVICNACWDAARSAIEWAQRMDAAARAAAMQPEEDPADSRQPIVGWSYGAPPKKGGDPK